MGEVSGCIDLIDEMISAQGERERAKEEKVLQEEQSDHTRGKKRKKRGSKKRLFVYVQLI